MDKVSIVILNYNEGEMLGRCIQSIYDNIEYGNYEIIVVDNGSSDNSKENIRNNFPKVIWIQNAKNYGFAGGNNIGMARALKRGADFVILLNNDTEVTGGWLYEMIKIASSEKGIGIVGPRLILTKDGIAQKSCYEYRRGITHKFAPDETCEVDCVTGACMLIKRCLIEKIGMLNEDYFPIYFEDMEYCLDARKANYKVMYAFDSIIYHHKGLTMKKYDWKYKTYHTNRLRFIGRNFPLRWKVVRFFMEIGNIMAAIKERKLRTLLSVYENFYGNSKEHILKERELNRK